MAESEYEAYKFQTGAHCIIEQYKMLMRCSDKKNVAEWNKQYGLNLLIPVVLQGAKLNNAYLQGASLAVASLEGALFNSAELQGACFAPPLVL